MHKVVAAVDIGTTSVKLLIRSAAGELVRQVTVTGLGEGVAHAGRLSEAAIERTCTALSAFRDEIAAHGADAVRCVATSASREAANRDEFFDRAAAALGVRPVLLSGTDEALLGYRGARSGFRDLTGSVGTLDIGGGSTELSIGTAHGVQGVSIDLGARVLTDLDFRHDPPWASELSNAIGRAHDGVEDALREVPDLGSIDRLLGVGSTITTVARVEIGQAVFARDELHGFVLTRAAIEDVFRTLATESLADRVHNPGLAADRAELIVGGCCVLVAVMRRLQLDELTVSLTNLLDALALDLLRGDDE